MVSSIQFNYEQRSGVGGGLSPPTFISFLPLWLKKCSYIACVVAIISIMHGIAKGCISVKLRQCIIFIIAGLPLVRSTVASFMLISKWLAETQSVIERSESPGPEQRRYHSGRKSSCQSSEFDMYNERFLPLRSN